MKHHSSVLHFSNNKQFWALFSYICYPFEGLLWRNTCLGFLPNFWLSFLFLWYSAPWGACIFWRLIICQLLYFQFRSVMWYTLWTHEHQASCPSPTAGDYSNSCPLSQWCHPTIISSVVSFFSHFQSFPASGSCPMSQFFTSGSKVLESHHQHQPF